MASAGLEIKSTDLAHSVYIHFLFLKRKKIQADHLSHLFFTICTMQYAYPDTY